MTKEEILRMTKKELEDYKWSSEFNNNCSNCSNCSDCSYCFDCLACSACSYCFDCLACSACSYCFYCKNAKGLKYAICNVEMTKEEFENKIKEIKRS